MLDFIMNHPLLVWVMFVVTGAEFRHSAHCPTVHDMVTLLLFLNFFFWGGGLVVIMLTVTDTETCLHQSSYRPISLEYFGFHSLKAT